MSTEGLVGIPLPLFDGGFWESAEALLSMDSILTEVTPAGSNSGSEDLNRSTMDERKRRRMISNRESARRSRMRKQKHLEDMRSLSNRLRFENRQMANRLDVVLQHNEMLRRENDRLRSESQELRRKLQDIRRFLLFRRLQHLASVNQQNPLLNA
ncbi:bZIP transcription factor 44-like [Aristolochia californica]|uniref:bZIP transcription factor 44-like n=1 Tax=Aristolochia californica TaxID=171875 RepID=UPI0035DEB50D